VASATVTYSPKKVRGPAFSIPAYQATKSRGIIDELGADVSGWAKGQRAGVAVARRPRRHLSRVPAGRFSNCRNQQIAGISYDGGYQQFMIAPVEALVPIPDSLE
jgi:D-arabinose 1-dehydrogenase-like Zn-dependent alcohol dehydrogenase